MKRILNAALTPFFRRGLVKASLSFTLALVASQGFSQQLIYSGKDLSKKFYLYEGDRLKIEYAGENKKMKVFFNGASDPAASYEEYLKKGAKMDNVELGEWSVTKDGPHKIAVTQEKGDYEIRLYRYPAPGKEDAPLTFTKKYSFSYEPTDFVATGFPKTYKKTVTTERVWDYMEPECYTPGDQALLDRSMAQFDSQKGIILYDDVFKPGMVSIKDKVYYNQLAFAFQAGDTVTFETTYTAPKTSASAMPNLWVARADEHYAFEPEGLGMPIFLLKTGIIHAAKPTSHSFVVGADGIFSFFFNARGAYALKVVRHVGKGGDPNFTIPFEMAPVKRSGMDLYFVEPLIKQ